MLVLSRRVGSAIIIGEEGDIVITVLGINDRQCRLGIEAPKDIPVDREEVFERKQAEKANG